MDCSPGNTVHRGAVSVEPYTSMSSAPGKATAVRRSTSVAMGEPPWAIRRTELTSRGALAWVSAMAASMVGTPSVTVAL